MIVDKLLTLTGSTGQAITSAATTASTDHINLSAASRNLGVGNRLYLVLTLRAGSVTTVTSPTVQLTVQTDDNTSFSSATTLLTSPAVALPTTSGTLAGNNLKQLLLIPLPTTFSYEQYLRCQIITGGTITTASYTFDLSIVEAADTWAATADGLDV